MTLAGFDGGEYHLAAVRLSGFLLQDVADEVLAGGLEAGVFRQAGGRLEDEPVADFEDDVVFGKLDFACFAVVVHDLGLLCAGGRAGGDGGRGGGAGGGGADAAAEKQGSRQQQYGEEGCGFIGAYGFHQDLLSGFFAAGFSPRTIERRRRGGGNGIGAGNIRGKNKTLPLRGKVSAAGIMLFTGDGRYSLAGPRPVRAAVVAQDGVDVESEQLGGGELVVGDGALDEGLLQPVGADLDGAAGGEDVGQGAGVVPVLVGEDDAPHPAEGYAGLLDRPAQGGEHAGIAGVDERGAGLVPDEDGVDSAYGAEHFGVDGEGLDPDGHMAREWPRFHLPELF